jgi:hypothetical protein
MSSYGDQQKAESIKAAGPYAEYASTLYTYFDEINVRHFGGQLEYPALEIQPYDKPNGDEFLGFCEPASCHCLNGKIGIDSRVIDFCELSDKFTHAKNVLLHEVIHLFPLQTVDWCQKPTSKNWHGGAFSAACNRVSAYYGWKPVRSSRKFSKKKKRHALNCGAWPHFSQNDPAAEADYFRMSRLLKASRLEARARLANPSAERDTLAVKACFRRLLEKASTPELKAEVFELHRTLSMHGKVDFDL